MDNHLRFVDPGPNLRSSTERLRLNLGFRPQAVDNFVDIGWYRIGANMAEVLEDLTDTWRRVIDQVAPDSPHKAFLLQTRPLGLLKGTGSPNLLIAAPNSFVKDFLENRLRGQVGDALTAELGERVAHPLVHPAVAVHGGERVPWVRRWNHDAVSPIRVVRHEPATGRATDERTQVRGACDVVGGSCE